MESRGFLLGPPVAPRVNAGFVPVRKKGKLPGPVISQAYELEYGIDLIQIQRDSIRPGSRCILIDDLLATGGTMNAAIQLIESCGAQVISCIVLVELVQLKGRDKLKGKAVHSFIKY